MYCAAVQSLFHAKAFICHVPFALGTVKVRSMLPLLSDTSEGIQNACMASPVRYSKASAVGFVLSSSLPAPISVDKSSAVSFSATPSIIKLSETSRMLFVALPIVGAAAAAILLRIIGRA